MFSTLSTILLVAGIFYLGVHVALLAGLRRVVLQSSSSKTVPVSVIVAARNEERAIGPLLGALRSQSYREMEIVIVNDRSTDGTGVILASHASRDPRIRIVTITTPSSDMPAKKNALRAGIAASRGEILCFTDADCIPGPRWVELLVKEFDPETGMVAGYSPYLPHSPEKKRATLLSRFIMYEELRGAIWSVGSIGLGRGWLCTGRNLAYRRSVYDAVGGFEPVKMSVSGDDDLFLQHVRRTTNWKIRYCLHPDNHVATWPPGSFSAFVNQRTRHFSAGKYFSFPQKLFFSAYHASNLILWVSFFWYLIFPHPPGWFLAGFGVKLCGDVLLMLAAGEAFRSRAIGGQFIFMEFLYVLYNTFIGPLGFVKKFRWKQA